MTRRLFLPLLLSLLLTGCGEDPFSRDQRGRTPLLIAVEEGELARAEALLARGAELETADDCRWTPLMRAAANGSLPLVELLLTHGASVGHRDKAGYGVLMVAAGNGHAAAVRRLVEAGAPLSSPLRRIDPLERLAI